MGELSDLVKEVSEDAKAVFSRFVEKRKPIGKQGEPIMQYCLPCQTNNVLDALLEGVEFLFTLRYDPIMRNPKTEFSWISSITRDSGLYLLPTIFNVLKGDLALVGPRPATSAEYSTWSEEHKQEYRRAGPGLIPIERAKYCIEGLWVDTDSSDESKKRVLDYFLEQKERAPRTTALKFLAYATYMKFKRFRGAGYRLLQERKGMMRENKS